MSVIQLIGSTQIIPVITIEKVEQAVPLAEALMAGGLNVLEITLRTQTALSVIEKIKKACPYSVIGAGTIIHPTQFAAAKNAGAEFAVSPAATRGLLEAAKTQSLPFLPGVSTPSEVLQAIEHGFNELKFFPAALSGGIKALKAMNSLFPNVRFCPTGGITAENMNEYLALANVFCVGGSWLAPNDLITSGDWQTIEKLAQSITS